MPRGRKKTNLTPEQTQHTRRFVEKALIGGLKPDEMLIALGKEFKEKEWPNLPTLGTIKAFVNSIRLKLEKEWSEVTQQEACNKRLLHLQLEAMYAKAMLQGDPKVAHAVWKDLYLMLIPKKPRGSVESSPQGPVGNDDLLDDDDIESMSDEALEALVEEGVETGEISSKVADHLIAKDQK